MLNLNQLAQFLAIARSGSLAAAAEELGLSSAALSKSLSALERQLGTRLFDRVGRGLQLTGAGQQLTGQAAELLGHADRLSLELRRSADGSSGALNVGCGPAALQGPVASLIRQLMEQPPRVQLRIESDATRSLLLKLRRYDLDFVVADVSHLPLTAEHADYRIERLPECPIQLVASRTHPLSARRSLAFREALDYPWVTPTIPLAMRQTLHGKLLQEAAPESAFARLATVPDVQIEDLSTCMHVAARTLCIAAALAQSGSAMPLPGSMRALPLELGLTTQIAVITLRARSPSPLAARAIELLAGQGPATSAASRR